MKQDIKHPTKFVKTTMTKERMKTYAKLIEKKHRKAFERLAKE